MKYRIFKYEAGLTIKKYEAIISTIIHPIPIFTSIRGAFSLHLSIRKGTFKKKARSELKSGPIDQLWDFRFFLLICERWDLNPRAQLSTGMLMIRS